jgi:hypothetical protein
MVTERRRGSIFWEKTAEQTPLRSAFPSSIVFGEKSCALDEHQGLLIMNGKVNQEWTDGDVANL